MFDRLVEEHVRVALTDTPVVLIVGPRRAGKSTLARKLAASDSTYMTLDDETALHAARSDPAAFIRNLDRVAIDEIQRAPELLLPIKKAIDEDQQPGRFLLTGSANLMTLPLVADSLAGRMETVRLLPLAQTEIAARPPSFLARLFAGDPQPPSDAVTGDDLLRLVLRGGFPEVISRPSERRRQDWLRAYLTSVVTRDLRDIAAVEKLTELPRFVRLLAEHSGQLVNFSRLGSGIGVSHKTAQRYVALLEQIFMTTTLQPWLTNRVNRIVKTPKVHFLDSGLLASTRGLTFDRLKADRSLLGPVLETFVFSEILKLEAGDALQVRPFHFRDGRGREVDIVLERDDGVIAGVEVKAGATVRAQDFAGLRTLGDASGARFAFGAVLYDGTELVHFDDRLAAVPLASLWG